MVFIFEFTSTKEIKNLFFADFRLQKEMKILVVTPKVRP